MGNKICVQKKVAYVMGASIFIVIFFACFNNAVRSPLIRNSKANSMSNPCTTRTTYQNPFCVDGMIGDYSVDCSNAQNPKSTLCIFGCNDQIGLCSKLGGSNSIPTPTVHTLNIGVSLTAPSKPPSLLPTQSDTIPSYLNPPGTYTIRLIEKTYKAGIIKSSQTINVGDMNIGKSLFTVYFMKQIPYFADMINLANKYTGPIGTVDASYYLNKQITIDELKIAEKNQLLSDLRNSTLCKDAKYSSTECTVPFILNNKEEKDIFTYVRFVKVSIAGVVESAYGFILNDYYDSVSLSLIYGKGYNIFENPKLTKIVMPLKTNFETGDVSTEIASLPTTTGYRYYSVSCLESLMKENGVQGAFTITPSAQRPSFNYRSTRIGILFIDIVNQQIQGMNFGFVNGNAKPTISFDKLNKCMVSQ